MTYWTADAVFKGTVTEISFLPLEPDGKPNPYAQKVVRFSVEEAYRGVQDRTVEIITNPNTPSCGYDFKQGQRYFVYARRRRQDGKLTESLCGPTVPIEMAARDLAYAKEIKAGESAARIVGAVVKYGRRDIRDNVNRVALSGVEVMLERWNQTWERVSKTTTNSEGQYEFRGLAVGTFRVTAALPGGPREWTTNGKPKEHHVELREGMHCGSDSFVLTTDGSIRGRLITPDGSPLPRQDLALVPLDESGNEISSSSAPTGSSLPESGQYYFREVPPGLYFLAVNPDNKPGKSSPTYPLMFYPGAMSRGRATIIRVPESRELNLEDFVLTPPLEERWFSGTVLLADKSPAAGAKVTLIDPNDRMMGTNVTEVTADDLGRFRVKGYETFPYWIDAYVVTKSETEPRGLYRYAAPVALSTLGSVEGIELVISLSSRSQPYHKY